MKAPRGVRAEGRGVTDQLRMFERERKARKLRSFHVRAHVPVSEVQAGERAAKHQEERVLAWMRARHDGRFTPWEVSEALGIPVTSARRALTNMTDAGLLVHHQGIRVESGPYGKKSGVWSAK